MIQSDIASAEAHRDNLQKTIDEANEKGFQLTSVRIRLAELETELAANIINGDTFNPLLNSQIAILKAIIFAFETVGDLVQFLADLADELISTVQNILDLISRRTGISGLIDTISNSVNGLEKTIDALSSDVELQIALLNQYKAELALHKNQNNH
ncbi:MAG: hypothetical protein ACRC37_00400 [Lentisphaeria bacterium]